MRDGLGWNGFSADRGGERKLVEERADHVHAPVAQSAVFPDEWEVGRGWQPGVECRQRCDLVGEIVLIDKTRFGGQLDQQIDRAPLVAPDVEVMPHMRNGFAPAAFGSQPPDVFELIERRGLGVDLDWRTGLHTAMLFRSHSDLSCRTPSRPARPVPPAFPARRLARPTCPSRVTRLSRPVFESLRATAEHFWP